MPSFRFRWPDLGRRWPILVGLVALVVVIWALPRSVSRLESVDGRIGWDTDRAPPTREVTWEPAEAIRLALPGDDVPGDLLAPQLAERGGVLYLARRGPDNQLDLYSSRMVDGTWQPAEPIETLNTGADEVGLVLAPGGDRLYFYSNRPGGHGGYDLYVSQRQGGGWATPRNLGPSVNTASDEFDPAISRDGLELFFASDRATVEPSDVPRWATTLRARPELVDFDLYRSTRTDAAEPWQPALPLSALNRRGSHEGAPFISPDGAFLYFATNRPTGDGEPANLDLYRARRRGQGFDPPRNLGPAINSAAHETEPALAAEGFQLVFASNRDGRDRLYQSVAREVEVEHSWSTSHLDGLAGIWSRALLITLVVAALVAIMLASRGWLWRRATASKFVAGSMAFHLVVVLALFFWKLDTVIEVIAEAIQGEPVAELFDDNQHQSHEDGLEAYEKVADLKSLDDTTAPQVVRQVSEPLSVPERTESPVPAIPLERLRSLPPERLLYVPRVERPPSEPVATRPLVRREPSRPREPLVLAEAESVPAAEVTPSERRLVEAIAAVDRQVTPPAAVPLVVTDAPEPVNDSITATVPRVSPSPTPMPTRRPVVAVARASRPDTEATAVEPEPVVDASPARIAAPVEQPLDLVAGLLPRSQPAPPKPGVDGQLVDTPAPPAGRAVEVPRSAIQAVAAAPEPDPQSVPRRIARRRPITARPPAEDTEAVELAAAGSPEPAESRLEQSRTARVALDRRAPGTTAPTRAVDTRPPSLAAVTAPLPAALAVPSELPPETRPMLPRRQLTRRSAVATRDLPVVGEAETDRATVEVVAGAAEADLRAADAVIERLVAAVVGVDVDVPRELTGPVTRVPHRIVIGDPGPVDNDQPPQFSPLATQLQRKRARAPKVALAEDNVGLRSLFTLRQGDTRRKYIELLGGTDESEEAVNRGLAWLVAHQNKNGSWSLERFHVNCKGKHANCTGAGKVRSDTAATGMALLPFLAAGHTHQSETRHSTAVARAIDWLIDAQKKNGDLLSKGDSAQAHMYSHGIASIALCEAFGMTEDPRLKVAAEKALAFIVKAQNSTSGGWRYRPGEGGDTSVVGWQMMALKSGEMAGLTVPDQTLLLLARWLNRVESNKPVGGLFGYQGPGASPAMTAEGLLCLQFMGVDRDSPRMRAGADFLMKHLPKPSQQNTSYYWYYATQVMYHMQGKYWKAWNEPLRDQLVKSQSRSGAMAGTWNPSDQWEAQGGRVYATAMKLLVLEVYYRHLPLYEQLSDDE